MRCNKFNISLHCCEFDLAPGYYSSPPHCSAPGQPWHQPAVVWHLCAAALSCPPAPSGLHPAGLIGGPVQGTLQGGEGRWEGLKAASFGKGWGNTRAISHVLPSNESLIVHEYLSCITGLFCLILINFHTNMIIIILS